MVSVSFRGSCIHFYSSMISFCLAADGRQPVTGTCDGLVVNMADKTDNRRL